MKVAALAGGVGAGKFLRGLVRVIPAEDVAVVVNTADDFELHGLHISPDLDSVTYWLAGLADRERGWGRRAESFRALEEVRRLGGQGWFSLGDLDLATHLVRTQWLHEGVSLSEVTDRIRRALGVGPRIVPMSDQPVRTWIEGLSPDGEAISHPFQVYWVGRGARDEVKAIRFEGAGAAAPAPGALNAVAGADVLLVCPSNPVVSIGPILAVPGMREALAAARAPVVAVSPLVGGRALKGPTEAFCEAAGIELSAAGIAAAYGDVLDGIVADEHAEILPTLVTDTWMNTPTARARLARETLDFARGLAGGTVERS